MSLAKAWLDEYDIRMLATIGGKEAATQIAVIRGIDPSRYKRKPVPGAYEDNPWGDRGPSPLTEYDLNPNPALSERLRVRRKF